MRAHPGAQVICRDRASGYAEGARLGAPDAIQVADRFHLLQNLTQAVDRVVRAHRACLKDRPEADAVAQPRPSTEGEPGRRAEVTRQRHAEIHALHTTGIGTTAISRALNLDGKTIRRYLRAATADELLTETVPRPRDLDEHTAYLVSRWGAGLHQRGPADHRTARTRLPRQRPHGAPTAADLARRHNQTDRRDRGRAETQASDRLDHPARRRSHRR
ncbi:transposase [Micromonospora sp. WMMA1363]|uniref:transposase n=1 Tax=Micromonospora sp. WMMA1363 TaxID=3053985 RepID=UPI00259CDA09|nr:transposase [Micromonospora sp. WMMA1363]MDM4719147.1 transposase [Micromonospora sp. WMMA1363]MDM4720146.1 transposase [Micromonospora sp. WMMA1363]